MAEYLEVAIRACMDAGAVIRTNFGKTISIEYKGRSDLVTEVDRASEEIIYNVVCGAFPHHGFLGEEGTRKDGDGARWIVDPLDGTTNFAHGYPFVAVSVALELQGEVVAGAVYDPIKDECFSACRGEGAYLNSAPIRVSAVDRLDQALLATGFSYDLRSDPASQLGIFVEFQLAAHAVRRDGAAALDLCYLAAGRSDGFWEQKLAPWDTAAGALIAREAGALVTDFDGGDYSIYGPHILATNGRLHPQMQESLARAKARRAGVW